MLERTKVSKEVNELLQQLANIEGFIKAINTPTSYVNQLSCSVSGGCLPLNEETIQYLTAHAKERAELVEKKLKLKLNY